MEIAITKHNRLHFESITTVVLATLAWRCAYVLLRYSYPRKAREHSCRILTLIHGLIAALLGINQCFYIDIPFYHPEWRTTYLQSFILAFSASYFIHDLIWCLQYDRKDKLLIAHHIYCVIFLLRILFKGISGAQTTCGLGAMELTNPLLQARWFIRNKGMESCNLFLSVEVLFLVMYVFIRIILGSYFTWVITQQPKNNFEFILCAVILYVISWMFFVNILRYVINKYLGVNGRKTTINIQ